MVISDTLVGSFLDVFFFLLAVILLGLLEKPSGGGSGVEGGERGVWGVGGWRPLPPFLQGAEMYVYQFLIVTWKTYQPWTLFGKLLSLTAVNLVCEPIDMSHLYSNLILGDCDGEILTLEVVLRYWSCK